MNRALSRALAIAGAPFDVIKAAKHLKCPDCAAQRPPRKRRVAALPRARAVGDVVHIDLVQLEDLGRTKHWALSSVDAASSFSGHGAHEE